MTSKTALLRKQLEDTGCIESMHKEISNSGIDKLIVLACEGNIETVDHYLAVYRIPETIQATFWRECYRASLKK